MRGHIWGAAMFMKLRGFSTCFQWKRAKRINYALLCFQSSPHLFAVFSTNKSSNGTEVVEVCAV